MKIVLRNLSFGYAGKPIFNRLNTDFDSGGAGQPVVILGPSGSGKTTLLKLMGGLIKVQDGELLFTDENGDGLVSEAPKTAFMFQEPRLLPWLTVLENVSLPLEKDLGKEEARSKAGHFLSLVSLEDKRGAYPNELSGGEAQRVSMARAFAWPAPALFMDEPFQSLDIPLRLSLMDLAMSLLEKNNHFLVAVTHDPREAVYMAGRIIILGKPGEGIIFDRLVNLPAADRIYGAAAAVALEKEIIKVLRN